MPLLVNIDPKLGHTSQISLDLSSIPQGVKRRRILKIPCSEPGDVLFRVIGQRKNLYGLNFTIAKVLKPILDIKRFLNVWGDGIVSALNG